MREKLARLYHRWNGLTHRQLLVILLLCGIVLRLVMVLVYQPVPYPDTLGAYYRLADNLQSQGLDGYDGTRAPGYPIFLMLVQKNETVVWTIQLLAGLMISAGLFWLVWQAAGHAQLSFIVGMAYNLIPGQFLFESNLLSETLTALFIVSSLALLATLYRRPSSRWTWPGLLALGILATLPGMMRPLFFPVTLWLLPFIWLMRRDSLSSRLLRLAVYSLGPLLIQGGWLLFINSRYDMLSPTTMAGYSLVNHTGAWFELLPDEEAVIRDIYLEFRTAHIEARGAQTNTIWDAIPEISRQTGLSFFALSRKMKSLSLYLIRMYPGRYALSVIDGWIDFWKVPVYWDRSLMSPPWDGLMAAWAMAGRFVSLLANVAFLVLSGIVVVSKRMRQSLQTNPIQWAVMGLVWWVSIVQTLVDHGDNPRFLMPLQMLVVYWVLFVIYRWRIRKPSAPQLV
jgi:hypothetical protein